MRYQGFFANPFPSNICLRYCSNWLYALKSTLSKRLRNPRSGNSSSRFFSKGSCRGDGSRGFYIGRRKCKN